MLERFRVEGYKALEDVTLELTPVHVLIGQNDTGKSSVLEVLGAFSRSADFPLPQAFTGLWKDRQLVWKGADEPLVRLSGALRDEVGCFGYELECRFEGPGRDVRIVSEKDWESDERGMGDLPGKSDRTSVFRKRRSSKREARLYEGIAGSQTCRFSPPMIALPAALVSGVRFGVDPTGFRLATCLDDILGDDRARFEELESEFRDIFPEVVSIKLVRGPGFQAPGNDPTGVLHFANAEGKGIQFEIQGSSKPVPAAQASDGVPLVLAYLTVLHLPTPPRFLLVEEPENGIHPQRLGDVVRMIREAVEGQSRTQMLLTTHSPYLLDEFRPEEVTVCAKDERGAVMARHLSECPEVTQRLDVFTLGEIWTGQGEEALFGRQAAEGAAGG